MIWPSSIGDVYWTNLSGDHAGPVVLVQYLYVLQRLVSGGEPKPLLVCCRFRVEKCEEIYDFIGALLADI